MDTSSLPDRSRSRLLLSDSHSMADDTPEKNLHSTPISSQCEESPVFNFINNLSPIEPVKPISNSQTFNVLPFVSPSSVFTSPQVAFQRESRFFRRNHFINLSRLDFSEFGKEDKKIDQVSSISQLSGSAAQITCLTPEDSVGQLSAKTCDYHSKFVIGFPKTLKYECSSPDGSVLPCHIPREETTLEMDGTQASLTQIRSAEPSRRNGSSEDEIEFCEMNLFEEHNEESPSDWEQLLFDCADLLVINSSINEDGKKLEDQKHNSASRSCEPSAMQLSKDHVKFATEQSGVVAKIRLDDQPTEIHSGTFGRQIGSSSNSLLDGKDGKEINAAFKPGLPQHRSIRRLVFEMSRVQKSKDLDNHSNSSDSLSDTPNDKNVSGDLAHGCSSCSLPGIGLHLNSLASTSNSITIATNDNSAFMVQSIRLPCSGSFFDSLSSQKKTDTSLDKSTVEGGFGASDNVTQGKEEVTPFVAVANDVDQCSPIKKRRKSEHTIESDACKRCNCKKSKCLKLYCECFAAGLYCVEPCSCQDCFNNPSCQETVLQTRKQIESRNPLAFAPKVIRSSEFVQELGEETKNTPASARHKRGCNCKKSSCLKKYCECFQGGVGCSINCRCEGCKNSFGRKSGIGEMEFAEEELEEYDKTTLDITRQNSLVKNNKQEQMEPLKSVPPSGICSSKPPPMLLTDGLSVQFSTSENLEKLTFERHFSLEKGLEATTDNETCNLECDHSPTSGVKSLSPNRKRVSPPRHKVSSSRAWQSGRKLILRSIPAFPSLVRHETSHHSEKDN